MYHTIINFFNMFSQMFSPTFEPMMQEALGLARKAHANNEVPVGAIVWLNDEIIGRGYNCPISTSDPTAHAEIIALRAAAQKINNYRILDATLVVTLEPCVMCFNAMIHARIKRLVFGAFDPKAGADSVFKLFNNRCFNHSIECIGGVLQKECGQVLVDFFQSRR
jgi:tRNA(adenine34) deaminase